MHLIDLRSDTVTKPTLAMRDAMAKAEVGDDVYREDPAVKELEEYSANLCGKEAALFVGSGTMGNVIPCFIAGGKGSEILMHEKAHTFSHELSGMAAIAGSKPMLVPGERGILTKEALESCYNRGEPYFTDRASMVIIENTHNFCGGTAWKEKELADAAGFAKKYKLFLHMDGARLFNAAAASNMSPAKICSYADSVTFCLSKGLGAPFGALLLGKKAFVEEARRVRKMLGGGFRQAGLMAAAGLYALKNNIPLLTEDYYKACRLAAALSACGWAQAQAMPESNIVFACLPDARAHAAVEALGKRGVLCSAMGKNSIRFVTHLDVSSEDIEKACEIIENLSL